MSRYQQAIAQMHRAFAHTPLDPAVASHVTAAPATPAPAVNVDRDKQALDLQSADYWVRLEAVRLGGLTPEQHELALTDAHQSVRLAATELGGLNTVQLERALSESDWGIRVAAVVKGALTRDQLERALTDPNKNVRKRAIQRGDLNAAQLHRALCDLNVDVRITAEMVARDVARRTPPAAPEVEWDDLGEQQAPAP